VQESDPGYIEDEDAMRKASQQKNLTKARGAWLYSYNPLTVPLV
jgi:hypothetical protein